MEKYTEQEKFWKGEFGDEYVKRNSVDVMLPSVVGRWVRMASHIDRIGSTLEFGSNIGLNERALSLLFPEVKMTAVEINKTAADECRKIKNVEVFEGSIFDFNSDKKYDLTFTSGVLIHINPEKLQEVYKKLYEFSNKYILVSEYYNPTPVEVEYRGEKEKLFKRDFAGEIMDLYPDLELIDYGFMYHRDILPADDLTYFLMRKTNV